MSKNIEIDQHLFLKSSKRLHKLLEEAGFSLKLSETQEMLSKTLGFRNFHELQKNINDESSSSINSSNKTKEFTKDFNFFEKMSSHQIVDLIDCFVHDSSVDIWSHKSLSLMLKISNLLTFLRDQKELELNTQIIRQHLDLDSIIKIFKKRKDLPENILSPIKEYLFFLPSFQEAAPKQNETVKEAHNYCVMPIYHALSILEKKSSNFMIAHRDWFEYHEKFMIKKDLQKIPFIDSSWIDMPEYQAFISSVFFNHDQQVIYVSDLIHHMSCCMSPQKKKELKLLTQTIFFNYDIAKNISQSIVQKMK